MPAIPFRKMNGLGNEFIVFDARRAAVRLAPEAIRALGGESGIGFDQMITIERSPKGADAFMRIHNRDGGEVDACGNATRCIGWLLMGETGKAEASIETNAGLLRAFDTGMPELITVDMGKPRFQWNEIPLAEPFHDTRAIELQIGPIDAPILHSPSAVNMGNPHAIFWVDDVEAYDLAGFGPMLENHPIFPDRANISLAHVTSRDGADGEDLGAWRRPDPRLRHRRLRRRGRRDAQAARRQAGDGDAARRPDDRRMARRRPRLDDRPGRAGIPRQRRSGHAGLVGRDAGRGVNSAPLRST